MSVSMVKYRIESCSDYALPHFPRLFCRMKQKHHPGGCAGRGSLTQTIAKEKPVKSD